MSPDCNTLNWNFEDLNCAVSACAALETGVDHPFNDIALVAATCCNACKKEDGSKLLSWRSDDRYCYLRTERALPPGMITMSLLSQYIFKFNPK